MASRLAIVPNEQISQINQEAVPDNKCVLWTAIKPSYKTNQLLRMWLVYVSGPLWCITNVPQGAVLYNMSIVKGKIYWDRFHFSFFFLKEIQLKS